MNITQTNKYVLLAGLVGFGLGLVIGAVIIQRVMVEEPEAEGYTDDEVQEQIAKIREEHLIRRRQEMLIERELIAEEHRERHQERLIEGLNLEEERPMVPVKKPELPVTRPYIISEEEFFANEPEHEQTTAVYYEGNQVLLDEIDEVVDDIEFSVGLQNLARVDGDTDDVVYIRNDAISLDYEVLREAGNYVEPNAASSVDKHDSS